MFVWSERVRRGCPRRAARHRTAHAGRDLATWVDTDGLEIHHTTRVADHGTSSLDTQVRICAHHHDLVTHQHYQLQGTHQTGWHLQAPERTPPPDTG